MAQRKKVSIKPKAVATSKKIYPSYILLVEDEPTQAAVIRRAIRSANPNSMVKVAGSLKEYRKAVANSLPDIVLMDLYLPDGKAFEVLTTPPEGGSFPIVVMTGFGNEKIAVKAMKTGALDYIVKSPDTLALIPRTLERAMREWKLIQGRKRAEEALLESEHRFYTLYENVSIGLYRTAPTGKILMANQALVKMLGYSTFEKLAERNLAKIGFDKISQRKAFLRKIEIEGEVKNFESTWIRQDGSLLIARESARAIRDSQGKTLYYDGTAEDITERRLAEVAGRYAEEALRESEEKFRSITENLNDVVFMTDDKGIITYISPAVQQLFGCTSETMEGHFFGEYLDENELPRVIPIFEAAIRNGIPTKNLSLLVKRKDGNPFHAELDASHLVKDGKILGTIGVIRDISDREHTEEALRMSEDKFKYVFEYSPVGKSITLPSGEINVNMAFCDMLGYSQEELQQKKWLEITHPEDIEITQREIDRLLSGKEKSARFVKRFLHKNGTTVWVDLSSFLRKDKDGKPLYLISTTIDITDRKQAEEALSASEEKYRLLFMSNPVPMWVYDADSLTFLAVNDFAVDHYGYTRAEFLNMTIRDIRLPEDIPYLENVLHKNTAQLRKVGTVRHLRKDGSLIDVEVTGHEVEFEGHKAVLVLAMDITERKRAEKEVYENNERLHLALKSANSGIWEWDLRTNENIWSDELWKLYGLEPHSRVPSYEIWRQTIHPDDRESTEQKVQAAANQGTELNAEWRVVDGDGSVRWLMSRGRPLCDANGNAVRFLGIVSDITARRQAEEAVRVSDRQFRELWGATVEGIVILVKGIIIEVNEAMCHMFGSTREQAIGKSMFDFAPIEMQDHIRERLALGTEGRFETPALRADGTRIILEVFAKQIIYQGKTVRMVTARDITEQRQAEDALRESEERMRAIVEGTPHLFFFTKNIEATTTYVSPTVEQITGYSPDLWLQRKDWFITEAKFNQLAKEKTHAHLRGEFTDEPILLEVRHANGNPILLEAYEYPILQKGKVVGLQGVAHDITGRRQAEEALRQMQKLEGLGTLAGGIAHDFNNILGIILAYNAQIKRNKDDASQLDQATDTISKAVDRGKTLVSQILTFARKSGTEFGPVNVTDVIVEIMAMIYETFPKVLTYSQNFDNDIPFINADRSQLHQALLNLCVNARDAMPNGGVLSINTRMISGTSLHTMHQDILASNYICIEVGDTGEGMTDEIRKRIFEPFFTTKEKGKGTGLGLAVVFGIVQSHKGFIEVNSELGKGTTVRLYFPASPAAAPIGIESGETMEEIPGGKETLLIVEDEQYLLASLQGILAQKGYTVLSADNGSAGVEIYEERKNDIALVITDLGLPRMTGMELCKRIKQIHPDARIIVTTGYLDPDMKSVFLEAGVQNFLYKPYDARKVLKVIRDVLNGPDRV